MAWNAARILESGACDAPAVDGFLQMLWRQRRVAATSFVMILLAAIVFGLFLADRYEARTEILVEQTQLRRAEPVMSGGADAQPIVNQQSSGDQELNSEIALLNSQDVLRQVVAACKLDSRLGIVDSTIDDAWKTADYLHLDGALQIASRMLPLLRRPSEEEKIAKAVDRLANELNISVIKLSNVIAISYRSSDRQLAANVLRALDDAYLKQHALAHHPPGELVFFQRETEQARASLNDAEAKLVQFTQAGGAASAQIELEDAEKRLSDSEASQNELRTSIAGTERRLAVLKSQANEISPRQTTQLKSADNGLLLGQLQSSLLDLEIKRTGLLTKFQPTYPLVQEVDRQIEQTKAALTDAQKGQVQEKTTDRDPNYEQVREELTRSHSELANLLGRSIILSRQQKTNQEEVRRLEAQGVAQGDLARNAKAAEDNYLLLLHKQEEARISDELDQQRLFNVSVVEAASVPTLPVHSAMWYLLRCTFLALLCALASAAGADRLDPMLRTQAELESILGVPVLASLELPTRQLPPFRSIELVSPSGGLSPGA
jgi:succinoglycan biosynthesis transport protein ExoP